MEAIELERLLAVSGRSQEWLGRQLGVRANTVWRWAHGKSAIPDSRADRIRGLLSTKCPQCGAELHAEMSR